MSSFYWAEPELVFFEFSSSLRSTTELLLPLFVLLRRFAIAKDVVDLF